MNRMWQFTKANKLKKVAMHIIAQRLSEEDIAVSRERFMTLDANHDGMVTFAELKAGIDKLGYGQIRNEQLLKTIQHIMHAMDADDNGAVHFTEFVAATLDQKHIQQEKVCWQAFRIFDKDQSGTISKKELALLLHSTDMEPFLSSTAMNRVLQEVDTDGDGMISWKEFLAMMKSSSEAVGLEQIDSFPSVER
eukprot:gnl/TRDRNA2_/TRDRNA2_175946_c0_seq1.p2 gnl/TRDRNA2_/TRDRNA2_175946_c0~~gnl/TRDRNA2_/TRDRNA2_175946_c0_seq1.p2  ORF type:complete len:193 (+),score=41.28 gnl/TRDRNA2_/TRDRNA2_175946_c0_seq1:530-1108(+)